jgi:hypothetical protein
MTEVLGPQTLLAKALPTGWDGTRIAEWKTREGITYQELASKMALALSSFNSELAARWAPFYFLTEELAMEYANGGSVTEAPDITDVDDPDALGGTTIGHMLPLRVYGGAIGGTKRYFRDARVAKINADVSVNVKRLEWRFEKKLLTRMFTNTENTIGSSGYDVPFVRGTGGTVDFAPPAYGGEAFTTAHDHFLGFATASYGFGDMLDGLAETLQEHGHEAPYSAIVSRADIASYLALTKFIEIVDPRILMIDRAAATTGPQFFSRAQRTFGHFGDFQSSYGLIELYASYRVPTAYAGLYKSYGNGDGRNPIAIRVHPDTGFGAYIVPETALDNQYPIKKLNIEMEYGVGVGMDRTNGAVGYLVSGGTYANPTIS